MHRKRRREKDRPEFIEIERLRAYVKEAIRIYLESEPPFNLRAEERKKYRLQIQRLRYALRACVYGEGGEKDYVKHYIMREVTALNLSVWEKACLLPLNNPERLNSAQRFRILLYCYMKQYGKDGFRILCEKWNLPGETEREDGNYFEITDEDIRQIYAEEKIVLTNREILELICEEVYEGLGHGIIDRLRDCRLEGISGGVAGLPEQFFRYENGGTEGVEEKYAHDSVFVMLNGITIRLSFLSFGSEQELKRVMKALLRFEASGELSYYRPYMVNDMKDGSRVFACRPPFSETWAFFIRKFDSTAEKKPEELLVGEGAGDVIRALKYFVSAGLHIAITGPQGSGKTTLLKTLVRYISPKYNLRNEESVFELWMRKEFPQRNILTFRETESVDATEGLDAFRKTDGNCLMMGEVGSIQTAALMIELSQVSEQQLFTHHAMTTEKLLGYFRNALLRTGAYSDERMAQEQVAEAFDIHVLCGKDLNGNRYVKEIAEITAVNGGSARVLYRYTEGRYESCNLPSKDLLRRMMSRIEHKERESANRFFDGGVELYQGM